MSIGRADQDLTRHARPLRPQVRLGLLAAAAGVATVAAFAVLAAVVDEPFRLFSKEAVESLGGRAYVGWMANLGSAVWLVGAVAGVLAGAVLLKAGRRGPGRFLLEFGAYTTVLVADDLFLLHESVYPSVGIPEEAVYLAYGLTALFLLHRHLPLVRAHDGLLFVLAVGLWVGSVAFDVVQETWGVHLHVLEDGSKLVGLVLWSTFLVAAAVRELTASVQQPVRGAARSAS